MVKACPVIFGYSLTTYRKHQFKNRHCRVSYV